VAYVVPIQPEMEKLWLIIVLCVVIGILVGRFILPPPREEVVVSPPEGKVQIDTIYRTVYEVKKIHDTVYVVLPDTNQDTTYLPLTLYWYKYEDPYLAVQMRTVYVDSFSYRLKPYTKVANNWIGLGIDTQGRIWGLYGHKNAFLGIGWAQTWHAMVGMRWSW